MSTTPRTMSPEKPPHTPERAALDQSMMVEPPTRMGDYTPTPPEETIRLNLQASPESPSDTQILSAGEGHNAAHPRDQQQQRRIQTPETAKRRSDRSDTLSPGHLAVFDWDDFQDRYEKALQEADEKERQMLEEFEQLVKYFNIWASASSTHDNERAVKRLQTRERYVRLSEQSLSQKKQHLTEVVKAFQSALALLSAT